MGFVLAVLGGISGIIPVLTDEKNRGDFLRASDLSVTPLMRAWKAWFTDKNLYAIAFALVTFGTFFMSLNQLLQ